MAHIKKTARPISGFVLVQPVPDSDAPGRLPSLVLHVHAAQTEDHSVSPGRIGEVNALAGRSKPKKTSNLCTLIIKRSTMTEEDAKMLVEQKYILGYWLSGEDTELLPDADEVVGFFDCFATGLVIPCPDFVETVLERY